MSEAQVKICRQCAHCITVQPPPMVHHLQPLPDYSKFVPRCGQRRISFVDNSPSQFAKCRNVNKDGKCEMFIRVYNFTEPDKKTLAKKANEPTLQSRLKDLFIHAFGS